MRALYCAPLTRPTTLPPSAVTRQHRAGEVIAHLLAHAWVGLLRYSEIGNLASLVIRLSASVFEGVRW